MAFGDTSRDRCGKKSMKVTRSLVSVVDDDESVRESLPDLLKEFGFAARAFSSAQEFLASDCVGETRCLILDIVMPGMTGPDLQQELSVRGQEIPIIFICRAGVDIGAEAIPKHNSALHWSGASLGHGLPPSRVFISLFLGPRGFDRGREQSRNSETPAATDAARNL